MARKPWSQLSENERRRRARMDSRQKSMFGPEHTNELRIPRALKMCLRGGKPLGSPRPLEPDPADHLEIDPLEC
jgi:hypothetical protein